VANSPPLAARLQQVENGIDNGAQIRPPLAPAPWLRRHQGRDQAPFRFRRFACIAQPTAVIINTGKKGSKPSASSMFLTKHGESDLPLGQTLRISK